MLPDGLEVSRHPEIFLRSESCQNVPRAFVLMFFDRRREKVEGAPLAGCRDLSTRILMYLLLEQLSGKFPAMGFELLRHTLCCIEVEMK